MIEFTLLTVLLVVLSINYVSPRLDYSDLQFGLTSAEIVAGDIFFEIVDPPLLKYSYRIRPAKDFGATFNQSVSFKKARLVPVVPLHSCTDLENYNELLGHIALAERGQCSFVYKSLKAQEAGARAIIITESVEKWDDAIDNFIEMVDDKMDYDINIPAGFLLGRNGAKILRTLNRLNRKYALINLPVNLTYVPVNKMNQPPWISW